MTKITQILFVGFKIIISFIKSEKHLDNGQDDRFGLQTKDTYGGGGSGFLKMPFVCIPQYDVIINSS